MAKILILLKKLSKDAVKSLFYGIFIIIFASVAVSILTGLCWVIGYIDFNYLKIGIAQSMKGSEDYIPLGYLIFVGGGGIITILTCIFNHIKRRWYEI